MKRLAIGILCVGLLAGTCTATAGEHGEKETAAVQAANVWLAWIDQGRYQKSWDEASRLFQKATTRENWVRALEQVRTPLGNLKNRDRTSVTFTQSLPGAPDGEYVVLKFNTSFAHKQKAVETLTLMKEDGTWRAAGYFIR